MTACTWRIIVVAASVGLLLAGAVIGLKSKHDPSEAIELGKTFTVHLQMKRFSHAYDLTTKGGYVGASVQEFEAIAQRQRCEVQRVVGTSPFQSNGNRLRRWARGQSVEMPEVTVEFEGRPCLLSVTVRRTRSNGWQVSKFATHAG